MERTHVVHALLTLALVLGAGEARTQPAQPVPPELDQSPLTGTPPASGYQGSEDLERVLNEVYGQILTTSQHAEIASWRPASPGWWLDPVRSDRTLEVRAAMAEALALLPDPAEPSLADEALRDSDGLFGFRVALRYGDGGTDGGGFGGATVDGYSVEYDAATRPDLYLFHEALAGLLSSMLDQSKSDTVSWTHQFFAIFDHLSELDRDTVQPIIEAFSKAVADYMQALFFDARISVQSYYQPIADSHAANNFRDYDLTDALANRRGIARHQVEAYVRTGSAFLEALPEDLEKRLVQYVVDVYLPSLKTLVVYASHSVELERIDDLQEGASTP